MPGKTKKRKRKHRGTKTGKIEGKGRTSRPRSRQEAMARTKSQKVDRRLVPPTWRGAAIRGGFFAALLAPISILFGQPVGGAILLAVLASLVYIPLGYYTDQFFHRRRMAKLEREREAKREASGRGKASSAGKSKAKGEER
ncbi:MAG: hypothetical protein ACR2K6_02365 [Solirubrobacterales bacterium]